MKTKPVFLSIFFLCAFLCCPPGSAFAKEAKDEPAYKLGEIVVSGEMTDIDDTAISDTITAEEIKATNSRTVAEALKFAPGVVITRGRKNEPEISVHGFSQEKTLFLIDGIPYYETYYGKLNLDQIPTEMISKIEVTKNAPSVLYGPNAQIAVVNQESGNGFYRLQRNPHTAAQKLRLLPPGREIRTRDGEIPSNPPFSQTHPYAGQIFR